MKTIKRIVITQVFVSDGSALYINGKLVSPWFTVGEASLVKALGFKERQWKQLRASETYYRNNKWPERLKDIILA